MTTTWRQRLYYLVLWLVALAFFAPVLWIFLAAFKSAGELVAPEPVWFFRPTLDNILNVFATPNFWTYPRMSFVLSIGAVVIASSSPSSPPIPSPASSRAARTS
jgi:ABC-type glycerol-3-phosphate transport system permease component